jgi:hypothetical protein
MIRPEAHSFLCESETDQAFAQASSAIERYTEVFVGLYEKLPRPLPSAKVSMDLPRTTITCSSCGGPSSSSGDWIDAPNAGKCPLMGDSPSAPDLDDRMAARTVAFTTAPRASAPCWSACPKTRFSRSHTVT